MLAEDCNFDEITNKAGVDEAVRRLAERGVSIGCFGVPAEDPAPDPINTNAPAKHMFSAYLRRIADLRYERLLSRLAGRCAARLRSSGGLSAGR